MSHACRLGRLLLISILLTGTLPPAAIAQAASVSVTATVNLPDGAPAEGVPVVLEVHDGTQIVSEHRATSDRAGKVTWQRVPAAVAHHARVGAEFAGIVYYSGTQTVAPGSDLSFDIGVFPVVSEGRPLHVETLHLIVQVDDPQRYRVLQFMTVINTGEAAFAGGPELSDGRRAGLVIPLPPGAESVRAAPFPSPEDALDEAESEFGSDRVLDARPVPPEGRQVAVTYDLVSKNGEPVPVRLALPYPAQSVSLMLGGSVADAVEITESMLEPRPAEKIGDQDYALWTAEALQPGSEIVFTIGPARHRLSTQTWALIGLCSSLVLAMAASLHGGNMRYGEQARDHLVQDVAELDREHQAGRVDSGEYFRRRGAAIESLLLLDQQLGGRLRARTKSGRRPRRR